MGIFGALKKALTKSSSKISDGIESIFSKKRLDDETLEELEELLILSDMSSNAASELIEKLRKTKFNKEISADEIKSELALLIKDILTENISDQDCLELQIHANKLNVILVCGVNGNGKTTTIGKLANYFCSNGKKVAIAACDTFRAAAIEQLQHWSNKALFITGQSNSDPASVAYKAMIQSKENGIDILFIDTAGRLNNQTNLMNELAKIIRTIKKIDNSAPHYRMLTLDATTGQNAYNQVEQFSKIANINSLVVTKLDGTAKAGALVGIVKKFHLPIHYIGIGEKVEDLKPFDSEAFSKALIN
ncbi:MAG: signal recognition particle-docking protein FtsY [Rickettsiaceae bacterium]